MTTRDRIICWMTFVVFLMGTVTEIDSGGQPVWPLLGALWVLCYLQDVKPRETPDP